MSWIKMTKDTLTHVIETLADKINAKQDILTEMTDSEITEMITDLFYDEVSLNE